MVKKFKFGEPIETGAVILEVPVSEEAVPYLRVDSNEANKLENVQSEYILSYNLDEKTQIFGLGEHVRGMNKRGFIYESHCSDDPNHDEGKHSLYGAHNFFLVRGKETFGIFIDFPGKVSFDFGYSQRDRLKVTIKGEGFNLYVIEGKSVTDICEAFRRLIGKSYIAPKWAMGYGQSRWSYMNSAEVEEVVKKHRENNLPLDAVYLDIDYMESFKDFTINKEAFPDLKGLSCKLKDEYGVRLVPIIDAGVKIEEGYNVYEEGVKEGYFCKNEKGEDFVGAVWPGKVHFPDFLQEKTRKWFGHKYKVLMDMGIEGFWNDMNEPAIFYSEEGLKEAFDALDHLKQMDNMGIYDYFKIGDIVGSVSNSEKDYARIFHQYNGETICHNQVHNLYGYNMTKAAAQAFDEIEPNKRMLLFSRASYIGMHRYGGIWTGDNKSWWSHLLLNIQMMPGLNMCGFIYSGADLGGFGDQTSEDLLLRWLEFGIFTPLMRNHSALGTRRQEIYTFNDIESFRNILGIRYGLMPYLYSEYMKAVLDDKLYFRPIGLDYEEDEKAWQVEDQLMVGESIMIAPVYTQNATGRFVYLPEEMLMVRMSSMDNRVYKVLKKGYHHIEAALNEVVIFIKPNHLVPMAKPSLCINELDESKLEICGYVIDEATYELYQDDGFTKDYNAPENRNELKVIRKDNTFVFSSTQKLESKLRIRARKQRND